MTKHVLSVLIILLSFSHSFAGTFEDYLKKAKNSSSQTIRISWYEKASDTWTGSADDKKIIRVYTDLSRLYLGQTNYRAFLKTTTKVLKQIPDHSATLVLLGQYSEALLQRDQALDYYHKAIQSSTDYFHYKDYIRLLEEQSQYQKAEEILKAVINKVQSKISSTSYGQEYLQRNQARLLGLLAWIYLEQNKFDPAFKRAQDAQSIIPEKDNFWILTYYYQSALWLAREALAADDYNKAIHYLKLVRKKRVLNKVVEKNTRGLELDTVIALLVRRKKIGKLKSPVTHRMLAIFIPHSKLDYQDKQKNTVHFQGSIEPKSYYRARLLHAFSRVMIEAMSEGKLTIATTFVETESVLKRVNMDLKYNKVKSLDYESIEPALTKTYQKYLHSTDTVVIYWAGLPGVSREAYGGLRQPVIVPYHLYSSKRGGISIPAHWLDGAGVMHTLVHELFHNIEQTVGIYPSHGYFKDRMAQFPAYKGENQWEYYDWHFHQTLPAYQWHNLNWSERYTSQYSRATVDFHLKLYTAARLEDYRAAVSYYTQSRKLQGRSKKQALIKSWKLHPDYYPVLEDLAWSATRNKEFIQAGKYYLRLWTLYPGHGSYGLSYLRSLGKSGDIPGLLKTAVQLVQRSPAMRGETVKVLEQFFWKQKDKDVKRQIVNRAIKLDPDNPRPYYLLAFVEYGEKHYTQALSAINNSLSRFDRDPDALLLKAKILNYLKQPRDVESLLNKAVSIKPFLSKKIAEHYYYLTYQYQEAAEKIKIYQQSIKWYPHYGPAHYKLGWLYYDKGDKKQARQHFQKAADLSYDKAGPTLKKYLNVSYSPQKPQIQAKYHLALYDNDATWAISRILDGHPETFSYDIISSRDVAPSVLKQYDALIVGGGMAPQHARELKDSGMDAIREYIKGGGHYLGVCAGSYLSLDHQDMLGIINARPKNIHNWYRGIGEVSVSTTDTGKKVFGSGTFEMRYANGPLLKISTRADLKDYEVLAVFSSDMAKNGAPRGLMPGTPAIVTAPYKKGRVLLFSPHPEYTVDRHEMIIQGLLWMLRQ